jgi:hypothetical protein
MTPTYYNLIYFNILSISTGFDHLLKEIILAESYHYQTIFSCALPRSSTNQPIYFFHILTMDPGNNRFQALADQINSMNPTLANLEIEVQARPTLS